MFGPKKKKVKRPVVPCEIDQPETDEINTEEQALDQANDESSTD